MQLARSCGPHTSHKDWQAERDAEGGERARERESCGKRSLRIEWGGENEKKHNVWERNICEIKRWRTEI